MKESYIILSLFPQPLEYKVIQKVMSLRHATVTEHLVLGSNLSEIPVVFDLCNCDVSAQRSIYHQEV
jgi:hypothetical protein